MELKTLRLKNFRSFSDMTEINVSNLNVIIGRNDVGKSSILEALDIFFNGKPDKNDLSIDHDNSQIEITCIFDDLPDEIILDDTIATSLKDEFLLNTEGLMEIKKKFGISGTGSVSEEAAIICEYPDNENLENLLSKKRTSLRLQFEDLGINPGGVNRNRSNERGLKK